MRLVRVGVVLFVPVRVAVFVFVFVVRVSVRVGMGVLVIVIVIGVTVIVQVLGTVGVIVDVRMLFFHRAPRSGSSFVLFVTELGRNGIGRTSTFRTGRHAPPSESGRARARSFGVHPPRERRR
jgi:hypothetical protein